MQGVAGRAGPQTGWGDIDVAPAPPALGAVVVHAANSTDMKLQLDGRTFASTSTSTLLTLSPSSFGTCNHVLWVSQAGTPFHMFSREALPLGNFPTRYSGARCPSLTPQIRTTTATLGNRSHRHSVLSQHPGWRMLPAVFALLYTSTVWTL